MNDITNNTQTLQAIMQKNVYFLDDELVAVRAIDEHIYVSIRHLCAALGLDRYGQVQRIRRQPVLNDGHYQIEIETDGGKQTTNMLRVDLVPLWLSGINTNRISDETIRNKLEQYQKRAAKILWEAFQEGMLTTDLSIDNLIAKDSPAAQAYQIAVAIMQIARQQMFLEAQIESHTSQLSHHEQRLEQVETILATPGRQITPEQASELSQAIKAVARVLSKQTKRNEYPGIYGELYRRYKVNTYKLLPVNQFEDAMAWLNEWLQDLTGEEPLMQKRLDFPNI